VAALALLFCCTRRTYTAAVSPPPRSIHVTRALASGSNATSTRPAGFPPSTRIGTPNDAPASLEKATFTRALSLAAVNHAIATFDPFAAIAGPFTGHAAIFHLSSCTDRPTVHAPST